MFSFEDVQSTSVIYLAATLETGDLGNLEIISQIPGKVYPPNRLKLKDHRLRRYESALCRTPWEGSVSMDSLFLIVMNQLFRQKPLVGVRYPMLLLCM